MTGTWHLNAASVRRLQLRALNGVADVSGFLSALVRTDRPFVGPAARLAFGGLRLRAGVSWLLRGVSWSGVTMREGPSGGSG